MSANAFSTATVIVAWIIEVAVLVGAAAIALGVPVARRFLERFIAGGEPPATPPGAGVR